MRFLVMLLKQSGLTVVVRVKTHLKSSKAKSFQATLKSGGILERSCVDTWNSIHLA